MKNTLIFLASVSVSVTAHAQELTYGQLYGATAEYSADGGADTDVQTLGGGFEFVVGSLTFSGDAARLSTDVGDADIGSVAVEYGFGGGLSLGIDFTTIDFEGVSSDITSIYGIYESGALAVGLSVGDSDDLNDEVLGAFASWDVTTYAEVGTELVSIEDEEIFSLFWDYDSPTSEFYAAYVEFETTDGVILSGIVPVGGKFSITGGYANFEDSGVGLDAYSIGAEYAVTETVSLGASLGRLSLDGGGDVDIISLGIEFETGKRTSARSSVTDVLTRSAAGANGLFGF